MKRLMLTLIGVMAMTAGCVAPPPGPAAPALTDTAWAVTAIKGSPTAADQHPTMTFTAERYGGNTGCNSFSGEFTQNGSSLTLRPAAVTEMACLDGRIMTQEAQFLAALGEVASITSTSAGAEALNASGQSVLSLTKAPTPSPRPLVGTTWKLTGIRSGGTSASVVADSTVTLTLAASSYTGRVCNTFGGELTTNGDQITFSAPHSTKMACRPPELAAQETAVLGTLATVVSWTISGTSLSLSAPDGSGLDFVAS